jgi:hypothetical protein
MGNSTSDRYLFSGGLPLDEQIDKYKVSIPFISGFHLYGGPRGAWRPGKAKAVNATVWSSPSRVGRRRDSPASSKEPHQTG